ncbi:MAG: DUF1761 family protein [Patescibacteria group bacterium]|nr:DUF1761 family protein [Patescibacteria group bacterium]
MITIIILAIAGAVIYAVIGTLWYSDKTPMGKIHMRSLGMDKLTEEERKQKMEAGKAVMPKMYAAQLGLSFLTSFWVVFVVLESLHNGLPLFMAVGFAVFSWLCFTVPAIGTGMLWSSCDRGLAWKRFFSDSASNLVTILAIAFAASLFA